MLKFFRHKGTEIHGADVFFNGLTGKYSGWIYNESGKIIGDYSSDNSVEIGENFKIEWK